MPLFGPRMGVNAGQIATGSAKKWKKCVGIRMRYLMFLYLKKVGVWSLNAAFP